MARFVRTLAIEVLLADEALSCASKFSLHLGSIVQIFVVVILLLLVGRRVVRDDETDRGTLFDDAVLAFLELVLQNTFAWYMIFFAEFRGRVQRVHFNLLVKEARGAFEGVGLRGVPEILDDFVLAAHRLETVRVVVLQQVYQAVSVDCCVFFASRVSCRHVLVRAEELAVLRVVPICRAFVFHSSIIFHSNFK